MQAVGSSDDSLGGVTAAPAKPADPVICTVHLGRSQTNVFESSSRDLSFLLSLVLLPVVPLQKTQPGMEADMRSKPIFIRDSYKGSGKLQGKVALITGMKSAFRHWQVLQCKRRSWSGGDCPDTVYCGLSMEPVVVGCWSLSPRNRFKMPAARELADILYLLPRLVFAQLHVARSWTGSCIHITWPVTTHVGLMLLSHQLITVLVPYT